MAEIIRCYREEIPAVRFVGKRYGDEDRVNGSFGAKWGEWFVNGWFGQLETHAQGKLGALYDNGDAYLGLMHCKKNEPFAYWIGVFLPAGTPVPEGFEAVDFAAGSVGTCWIYGSENGDNLYGMHDACMAKLRENGMELRDDFGDGKEDYWFFERYACPRFTTPDEHGKVILDYCAYII